MDLQCEIAYCRNVCAWFTDPKKPNPCSRIIESQGLPQNAEALERFQLPEPWQGHLDRALILFVSSNPSIDPRITKPYPYWSLPREQMRNCYDNSFDHEGGWIKNGKQFIAPDGKRTHNGTGPASRKERSKFYRKMLTLAPTMHLLKLSIANHTGKRVCAAH